MSSTSEQAAGYASPSDGCGIDRNLRTGMAGTRRGAEIKPRNKRLYNSRYNEYYGIV